MSHNIAIRVGDKLVEHWQSYSITSDMLNPADGFSMALAPATAELRELVAPNARIAVLIDDVQILDGFIDERTISGDKGAGTVVEIAGRDKAGRLVDESMDPSSFRRKSLVDIVDTAAGRWFNFVLLTNEENRVWLRGGRRKGLARSSARARGVNTKLEKLEVEPGESRWDAISRFVREAGLLAWSSADGEALIVSQPDYTQDPQYAFIAASGEVRGNIVSWSLTEDLSGQYSEITVLAAGRGDHGRFGKALRATSSAISLGDYWTDDAPKRLIIAGSDARNTKTAEAFALDELAKREGEGTRLTLTVQGHSQRLRRGAEPAKRTDSR